MNKFEFKNLTPFKWFVLENFPFIEADFDALTEWQLFCKLGKEMNKIINSENTLGTQMENVTNAFIELQNYVNNYFDNLDVQNEINNKLNEMAESGELQNIIGEFLKLNSLITFNNVEEMKNSQNLIDGSFAQTLGFYNYNDGGNALYKIRNITNDDVVDNMLIISLDNKNLIAELITDKSEINIKQLGAQESLQDDVNDIKPYLERAFLKFDKIIIPNGTYFLSKFIFHFEGLSNKKLVGEGATKIYTSQGLFFEGLENSGYTTRLLRLFIENLMIYGGRTLENKRGTGINLNWFGEIYISNCYFMFLDYGIKALNGSEMEIRNCISLGNNYGIYLENPYSNENSDLDAVSLYNCPISNNTHNLVFESVRGVSVNDCIIANSKTFTSYGIEIKNSHASTNNINISNCEFENNNLSQPSILSGSSDEINSGCNLLNITNSKFVSYGEKIIQLNNGQLFNLTNTIISTQYQKLISIGSTANDLKINLQNCHRYLPSFIEDNRTKFFGTNKFDDMKRLNFFPDMKHGIIEFSTSSAPTYDNGLIKFSNSGFLNFKINDYNYLPKNGLQCLIIGKNLGRISAIINGAEVDLGRVVIQTLENGSEVINVITLKENITGLRFKYNANSEISKIEIYGDSRNELPKCPFTSISNRNFIGDPSIGDTISITAQTSKNIVTWNGTEYV